MEEILDFRAIISNHEQELIAWALVKTNGNKKQAAALLNLKRTTLIEKLKRFARNAPQETHGNCLC